MPRFLIVFLIYLIKFFTSTPALAQYCAPDVLAGGLPTIWINWRLIDREDYQYKIFKRSLLLGSRNQKHSPPSTLLENGSQVVVTNLLSKPDQHARVDNLNLPFRDGVFDFVLMNRGLCFCYNPSQSCCGVEAKRKAMLKFTLASFSVENLVSIASTMQSSVFSLQPC